MSLCIKLTADCLYTLLYDQRKISMFNMAERPQLFAHKFI